MIPRRLRLRVQLTLLYAIPFFATGAVLASIPLFGAESTAPVGSTPSGPPGAHVETHGSLTVTAISVAVLTVLSLLVGWWVAGRFLHPLRMLTATAREISATNLNRRLDLAERNDEYGELAETLDDLFARLGAAFDSQRRFVANAAHELRTPLTAERALLQVALANPRADPEELRRACTEVLALGRRQERLIDALLTLASSEQGIEQRLPVDLPALVTEALDVRRADATAADVHLTVVNSADVPPATRAADDRDSESGSAVAPRAAAIPAAAELPASSKLTDARWTGGRAVAAGPVVGDANLVGSLVANLLDNALRHNVRGGRVEVGVGGNWLSVSNDGPVVPADDVAGLFEPFRQLGADRLGATDGHGLGLAIVRAIADAHGAELTAAARPAGGLDITVAFPPTAT